MVFGKSRFGWLYFQKIWSNKTPSVGYRTIPLLVKHGILDSVWTTNFDDLINASCIQGGITGIDISLDSVNRINQRTQSKNELQIIKIHGDFKYGDLKNTSEELKNQDNVLRAKLEDYYQNHAPRLRQEGLQLFADKMLAFRTELEVMEEFYGETN